MAKMLLVLLAIIMCGCASNTSFDHLEFDNNNTGKHIVIDNYDSNRTFK